MWRFYVKRYLNPLYLLVFIVVGTAGILLFPYPAVWISFLVAVVLTWLVYIIIMETLNPTDNYVPQDSLKDDEADAWNRIIKDLDDIR